MTVLRANIAKWNDDPFVVRVAASPDRPQESRGHEAFLLMGGETDIDGFRALLRFGSGDSSAGGVISLPESFKYLQEGDILRFVPRAGEVATLYRRRSAFNALFMTERCNSNCIMCSQPPRDVQDGHHVEAYLQAIPLMDLMTPSLGITGGEPTLLGDGLIEVVRSCAVHLPFTSLHLLSNGRLFNYMSLSQSLAAAEHPDLMVGIPLYSDLAARHDFVVQAKGAFDQTIRGVMNLKRCNVPVEIRVVLHAQTVGRLPELARFISRNLPNVDHVVLMGLENMGYVKMNLQALWIDPVEYQSALREAVETLAGSGMNVSIYNHPLCVLDRELWPFAKQSISDWKNEYLPQCGQCSVKSKCSGFFASYKLRYSDHIRPMASDDVRGTDSLTRKVGAECG